VAEGSPRPLYEADCGSINLKVFRTIHVPNRRGSWNETFNSTGVVIDDRIVFTGDTIFDKELLDWLSVRFPKTETIFHDCQMFKGGVHASYNELLTLPAEMRKKIFLCHYSDVRKGFTPRRDGFAGFAIPGVYYVFD